ncbi:hypothetical protein D3C72_1655850 [compost metagenome]
MSLMADSGCNSTSALTLPVAAKASASAMSWRVPTKEPRIVTQLATTSNSGVGKSPGGKPTSTHVPRLRVIATPCWKASSDGAVISTPWAPPPVASRKAATGSPWRALMVTSAPRARACSSLPSSMSTAATRRPMASAYSMAR